MLDEVLRNDEAECIPTESHTGEPEHFSFFQRGNQSQNSEHAGNINQLHEKITTCPAWKQKILAIRSMDNKDAQKKAKERLPAFTPSILLNPNTPRRAVKDGTFLHNNLIQADFDGCPDPEALLSQLKDDPHCRQIFRSPRGNAKALIQVRLVETVRDHAGAFQAVHKHCLEKAYGEIDPKPKNIGSLCYVSHDPEAVLKDAVPLQWEALPDRNTEHTPASEDVPIEHQTSLADWLAKQGITVLGTRIGPVQNGATATMYLVECPWNQQHTTGDGMADTAVFEDPETGRWSFNCFHAHCDGRGWQDYREKVAKKPIDRAQPKRRPQRVSARRLTSWI